MGFEERPIKTFQLVTQLAEIDEDVHSVLKTDVRPVVPWSGTMDETKVKTEEKYYVYSDPWGITWKMPKDHGLYYDMTAHPLSEVSDISEVIDYFTRNPIISHVPEEMKTLAEKYLYKEQKAIIVGRDSGGLLEMALWLRGFENFFMDLAINPSFAAGLLDIILEIKCRYWEKALKLLGENAFIVSEADDLGTQHGLLISREMYQKLIKPRHKRLFDFIRNTAASKVYIHFHSCGAIKPLIPDLIEVGVDILNPVQVSARDMDTKELKRLYGKDITFWGGGIDTQHTLPYGTPEEVREETKRRIEDLAPGGGFIFSTVHCVQAGVPPQNFMAMWETLQEYGEY